MVLAITDFFEQRSRVANFNREISNYSSPVETEILLQDQPFICPIIYR